MKMFGIDTLVANNFAPLVGQRVGLLTHPAGVDSGLTLTLRHFRAAHLSGRLTLGALFSPEHGINAHAAEGEPVSNARDPITGVPIYSLYGVTLIPTPDMLDGLDAIVIDLQDIGVRYYTYAWTATHVLDAVAEADIRLVVLDRPNPLGAVIDAAAPLDPALASLVGRCDVPIRHGLSLGELLTWYNLTQRAHPARLQIITYNTPTTRAGDDMPLLFIPPSPNMPSIETVHHYIGSCLIEGTNLSEGRGTALPFQITGAPFLSVEGRDWLLDAFNALGLPGVRLRAHDFNPASGKWAGEVCVGVQMHRLSADFRAVESWLALIVLVARHYPHALTWNAPHFDRLIGSSAVREAIIADRPLTPLYESWRVRLAMWSSHLRYVRMYS